MTTCPRCMWWKRRQNTITATHVAEGKWIYTLMQEHRK